MRQFPPGATGAVTIRLLLLGFLSLPIPTAAQDTADPPPRACTVERIVDGDTFVCADGERVRLLLVNTPETHQRPYGPLATEVLEGMIPPGTRVGLRLDVDRRDRYGRLLAHVFAPDGTWINRELARRGVAEVMVVPPNVRRVEEIRSAARTARREEAGFWDADVLASGDAEEAGVEEAKSGGRPDGGRSGCHPSYPGVCIPPPPPDLDCGDLTERDVRVRGSDPHGLDGDGDGRGCEG